MHCTFSYINRFILDAIICQTIENCSLFIWKKEQLWVIITFRFTFLERKIYLWHMVFFDF